MVCRAISFLAFLMLPVQGSRRLMSGLMRTSRPRWRAISEYLHELGSDIEEAEPYVKTAGALERLTGSKEGENFHLAPEQYLVAQKLFNEKLDADGNGVLSKSEFLKAVSEGNAQDPRLLEVGRDIFKFFSSGDVMPRMQFLRFYSVCVAEPDGPGVGASSFILKGRSLSGLSSHEKSCLAKLFVALDANADGEVNKNEFDAGYDGELLRRLRQQGYINCGPSRYQLQQADAKLEQFSGGQGLPIDRFYDLTAEVVGESPKLSVKSHAAHMLWRPRLIGVLAWGFLSLI